MKCVCTTKEGGGEGGGPKIDLVPLITSIEGGGGGGFRKLPVDVKEKRSRIIVFYLAESFTAVKVEDERIS